MARTVAIGGISIARIMIAELLARGRGRASAALCRYGTAAGTVRIDGFDYPITVRPQYIDKPT